MLAATKHGTLLFDRTTMVLALLGATIPSFWLALLLILVFSAELGWLPAIGAGDGTVVGTLRARR